MRFKLDELALVAVCSGRPEWVGRQCQVLNIGPFERDTIICVNGGRWLVQEDADYITEVQGVSDFVTFRDWQLRKLDPPEEPQAMTKHKKEETKIS